MPHPTQLDRRRREFLGQSLWLVASLPFLGQFLAACDKKGVTTGSDTPPNGEAAVSESDPVAASLGYRADATKVDTAKFPKRKGAEGEKQFCNNCQFFTAKGDSGWGACQIIRSGDVKATGWCNTWAKKANA
jgi:hypothetical protein